MYKNGTMDKKNLRKEMWAVAKEYARQFGEIIGYDVEFWVGDDPGLCCFGDTLFFTLDDMRVVVDNIDKYVERYGSRQAVGEEIREWVSWWLDGSVLGAEASKKDKMTGCADMDDAYLNYSCARVTYQLRPNINLESWLDGCPRDDREPWMGPDAEYLRLCNDRDALERLINEHGTDRNLYTALLLVRCKLGDAERAKRERDRQEYERITAEWHKHFGKEDTCDACF